MSENTKRTNAFRRRDNKYLQFMLLILLSPTAIQFDIIFSFFFLLLSAKPHTHHSSVIIMATNFVFRVLYYFVFFRFFFFVVMFGAVILYSVRVIFNGFVQPWFLKLTFEVCLLYACPCSPLHIDTFHSREFSYQFQRIYLLL